MLSVFSAVLLKIFKTNYFSKNVIKKRLYLHEFVIYKQKLHANEVSFLYIYAETADINDFNCCLEVRSYSNIIILY